MEAARNFGKDGHQNAKALEESESLLMTCQFPLHAKVLIILQFNNITNLNTHGQYFQTLESITNVLMFI